MSEGFFFLLSIASRALMSNFYTFIEFLSIIWENGHLQRIADGPGQEVHAWRQFWKWRTQVIFSPPSNTTHISVDGKHDVQFCWLSERLAGPKCCWKHYHKRHNDNNNKQTKNEIYCKISNCLFLRLSFCPPVGLSNCLFELVCLSMSICVYRLFSFTDHSAHQTWLAKLDLVGKIYMTPTKTADLFVGRCFDVMIYTATSLKEI